MLFAYLFGIRYDISEIALYCKERGIDVLEDVAESFVGLSRFIGNQHSTMSMFSLGMIKINSTFYGGLTVIRDNELFNKMKAIQETYIPYSPAMFRRRIRTAMALYNFINTSLGNRLLTKAADMSGKEREEFFVSLSRGFSPEENFLAKFRFNPCAPLLSFIYQRLEAFNYQQFDLEMSKYKVNKNSI